MKKMLFMLILVSSAGAVSAQRLDFIVDYLRMNENATKYKANVSIKKGTNYVPGSESDGEWDAMNVRADLLATTASGGVAEMTGTITSSIPGIEVEVATSVPGSPPPNYREVGFAISRITSVLPDVPASGDPVFIFSFELTFSEPLAQMVPKTFAPRHEPSVSGSFWSNPETDIIARRPLLIDVRDPLPVTLISFDLKKEGSVPRLEWASSEETNTDRFEIQRSTNGKQWRTIGTVGAAGESRAIIKYNYTDEKPLTGTSYYRLKMIDIDGTFAYSRVRTLWDGNGTELTVYPNPTSDYLDLRLGDQAGVKSLVIVDQAGRQVFQQNGAVSNPIDVKKLPLGKYVISIFYEDSSQVSKQFIVQR